LLAQEQPVPLSALGCRYTLCLMPGAQLTLWPAHWGHKVATKISDILQGLFMVLVHKVIQTIFILK